jgi:hypothetical protein
MDQSSNQPKRFKGARAALASARHKLSNAIGRVPGIAGQARRRAGQATESLPAAMDRAELGARSTVTSLQTMSDTRLRLLAATSVGFGAGLRLAGASRLATLAGFVPASVFGFAIVSRPSRIHVEVHPTQP